LAYDVSKVNWTNVVIDALGIAGDVGLLAQVYPVYGLSELVEIAGLAKDVMNPDIFSLSKFGLKSLPNLTIPKNITRLIPGLGGLLEVVEIAYELNKGFYMKEIYFEN